MLHGLHGVGRFPLDGEKDIQINVAGLRQDFVGKIELSLAGWCAPGSRVTCAQWHWSGPAARPPGPDFPRHSPAPRGRLQASGNVPTAAPGTTVRHCHLHAHHLTAPNRRAARQPAARGRLPHQAPHRRESGSGTGRPFFSEVPQSLNTWAGNTPMKTSRPDGLLVSIPPHVSKCVQSLIPASCRGPPTEQRPPCRSRASNSVLAPAAASTNSVFSRQISGNTRAVG